MTVTIKIENVSLFTSFCELFVLRWYGTPCNIFKDDRILKNDYNHCFKNFKIYNICPKNAFIKFHRCMIRTRDPVFNVFENYPGAHLWDFQCYKGRR